MSGFTWRHTGFAVAFAGTLLVLSGAVLPSQAYEPPSGQVEYAINHSKYGLIGSHTVSFSHSGDDLIVTTVIEIKVKILFLTVHRVESERREVWRGGRLVAYRARTKENKDLVTVSARMEGIKLVISGSNGVVQTSDAVFPTHPWNPDIINYKLLMDTKTGELLNVSIQAAGEETIQVAEKPVPTKKYMISGDLERELWFDNDGNWIQLRFVQDGATITFTRVTPMEPS